MTPDPRRFDQPTRPPRRYSPWTLLAPAALVIVVVLAFNAVGHSCAVKDCGDDAASNAKQTQAEKPASTPDKPKRVQKRYRVRSGDNLQTIAAKFELSEDDLKACNPEVFDFRTLQVGQILQVNPKTCEGAAERAAAAGDTVGADVTEEAPA